MEQNRIVEPRPQPQVQMAVLGLTPRMWLAHGAMTGMLAALDASVPLSDADAESIAIDAFKIADAMVKESSRK